MLNLQERAVAGIKLLGGRPCLDFVNTIGGRKEVKARGMETCVIRADKLNDYSDLLAWGLHTGLLSESDSQKLLRESFRPSKPRENRHGERRRRLVNAGLPATAQCGWPFVRRSLTPLKCFRLRHD